MREGEIYRIKDRLINRKKEKKPMDKRRKYFYIFTILILIAQWLIFFGVLQSTPLSEEYMKWAYSNGLKNLDILNSYLLLSSFILIVVGLTLVPKSAGVWISILILSVPHLFLLYIFFALSELNIKETLLIYFYAINPFIQ